MKKRITLWLLATFCLANISLADAQQPKKIPRLGFLTQRTGIGAQEEAFQKGLRELGFVEGRNVVIEWRFAEGKVDRLPDLAAELVKLKVDCIIASGVNATRAAKDASSTIPIVMANASDDPVRLGLVASLARPGGNITGFTDIAADLAGKRLELLKEVVPKASRISILWASESPAAATQFRETEIDAQALGLQLQSLEVRNPDDLEAAFQSARKGRSEALIVSAFGFFQIHRERITNLGAKARLPVMYSSPFFVTAGGLMYYGPEITEQFRRAAIYVDKILKGTKPADLPVEQPTKFELVINLKAAKQIGLTIPPNVLARADKVIR